MSTKNDGILFLHRQPLQPDELAVFCVLGLPGGGTTMTSRLLEASGVFMGGSMPFNAEDPEFARLLKEQNPDRAQFYDLVAKRNESYRRWGFKAPFRYHWDLLAEIDNVRYVTVFRDLLAVANRTTIAAGVDSMKSLNANLGLQRRILDFVASTDRPQLLYSYEKALLSPEEISEAILQFVGVGNSDVTVSTLVSMVQPNEPVYVTARVTGRQ